jgi:hypothetical protein
MRLLGVDIERLRPVLLKQPADIGPFIETEMVLVAAAVLFPVVLGKREPTVLLEVRW